MRNVILNLAISFDGLIEGPNGELDWIVKDETVDYGDILTEILSDKDLIFYGRVAYEKWGNIQPEKNAGKKIKDAYHLMHSKTKYVFSKTMKEDGTEAIFISSDIEEKVRELKQQPGKNIWLYGGAKIATTFFNLNLIDELRLAIHPVILGKGKPLFQNIEHAHKLKLVEIQDYASGIMLVKYKVYYS
ncbi:dihydrofolate reductase family protein [Chryseobacterium pennipullorum]|uniref:Dihydrofolate reductase n=1 Tax=Chryseobacterium pennipullorum TaxID=2258963 RepID=A0A3D9AVX8_9FLAO|nr:dihydrofolate reductase family protein [Chryseobacterium pennipullorum]REC45491.1 dihydrofolate reductase [Chryseobacterium pennipullorum]